MPEAATTWTREAAFPPVADAVIVAEPSPIALTRPVPSTIATDGFDEAHEKITPPSGAPVRSRAVAVSRSVSLVGTIGVVTKMVSSTGVTDSDMVAGRITRVARSILSALAMISTTPSARGVTVPDESIVAIDGSEVDHANVMDGRMPPFLPVAIAEKVMRSEARIVSVTKIVSTDGVMRTSPIMKPGTSLRFTPVVSMHEVAASIVPSAQNVRTLIFPPHTARPPHRRDPKPQTGSIRFVEYVRPGTITDASGSLSRADTHALGGGTDLLVTMREGIVRPERLVDLRAIPGSEALTWGADGSLRIGASATVASIAADPRVQERFATLAMACEAVGSPALRNMGTIGGNLCQRPRCWYFRSGIHCLKTGGNDCPAFEGENTHLAILGGGPCYAVHPSDPAVALTALDALVQIAGPAGARTVPIADFFVLPDPDPRRETVLDAGEFITAIDLPAESSGGRQRYAKVLQRGAWDFALASLAVVRRPDGNVRMVLGGVAPIPWRVNPSVEEDVASAPLSGDDIEVLAERALYDAHPLSRNSYKVALAQALLREGLAFLTAVES